MCNWREPFRWHRSKSSRQQTLVQADRPKEGHAKSRERILAYTTLQQGCVRLEAATFCQIERWLQSLVDLEVSAQLPLVQAQ